MVPPHGGVALMAAVAAAALLLTLDSLVARATGGRSWGVNDDHMVSRSPYSVRAVSFAMTESERRNTLKVLQAFAAAMPSLRWSGDDFCSWSGVACFDANVSIMVTHSGVTGSLPEMPDDVDYSMVKVDEIHFFGQKGGITGTLPSSWSKLQNLLTMTLGYTSIRGTLPAVWSRMVGIEHIAVFRSSLTGTLPEAWSRMPKLRRVYLVDCNLCGPLPESWARMPSLESLSLHKNHFCGCVPQSWLTSPILLMGVDAKYRTPNCTNVHTCVETAALDPIGSSVSTVTTGEPTAPSAPSDPQCGVANCLWCLPEDLIRCSVCTEGYLLTDGWQCRKRAGLDAAAAHMRTLATAAVCVAEVVGIVLP